MWADLGLREGVKIHQERVVFHWATRLKRQLAGSEGSLLSKSAFRARVFTQERADRRSRDLVRLEYRQRGAQKAGRSAENGFLRMQGSSLIAVCSSLLFFAMINTTTSAKWS